MKEVTAELSEKSVGSKMNSDLKCESCEGHTLQSIPGEAEALSALNEACTALQEIREIAGKMDLSSLLVYPEGGGGENHDEHEVQEAKSYENNNELDGLQGSHSLGTVNEPGGVLATEKLVEIVASRITRKYGRKSMRITLSAKADTPAKENEDKSGSAKPSISSRLSPEEKISIPVNDSTTSHATGTQTENTRKKTWNFFKFLFGNRKRK